MIVLSLEEFAPKRRRTQARIEAALRGDVKRALDGKVNTDGYSQLMQTVSQQWRLAYAEEAGHERAFPAQFRNDVLRTLRITDRSKADENTVNRITAWLATGIISTATIEATNDDPEELFLEWVDMNDSKVRETHAKADGQQRPVGEKFDVGGKKMRYPGDTSVPIELWVECRCTLRPVRAVDALAASGSLSGPVGIDTPPEFPLGMNGPAGPCFTVPDNQESTMTEVAPEQTAPDAEIVAEDTRMRWHGVLAPEGIASGDGRVFNQGSLSVRPLPLPLTWQKTSADGHGGNVTVAKIEQVARVGNEMRACGVWLSNVEADEVIGLIAEFGKFGVSVDADQVTFEMNDTTQTVDFSEARIASACIVPIPAFAEAWVALGNEPVDFFADGESPQIAEGPVDEALVAADVAPGITEDGPGWLTNPVDTDRLRDYWVRGEGAAKIAWGVPGDFNRCRINLAEYVKPEYLNGYCANRHFDALGVWPGQEAAAKDSLTQTDPAEAINMVASGRIVANSEWFADPELTGVTPLTITEEGRVFGHIAGWKTCHSSWADKCTVAPHSTTGYAHFLLGGILTDVGEIPCGTLSIGGGHAGPRLNARAAIAHYDSTSSAFAYVNVGEDDHGIWFSGMLRPGISEATIVDARAAKISGDWRRDELVAALAVNVPGFGIPRIAASVVDGEQMSLVAAGVVEAEPVEESRFDLSGLAAAVAVELDGLQTRKSQMAELAARVQGS